MITLRNRSVRSVGGGAGLEFVGFLSMLYVLRLVDTEIIVHVRMYDVRPAYQL